MSHFPHSPTTSKQVHLRPCNATQGQVSVRCEATTIHSSSPNIPPPSFVVGWWVSAASQLRVHSQRSTAYSKIIHGIPQPLMQFQEKTLTLRAKQILNLKTIQVAVRRDLVKVHDPSLKKAPPDAVEFGSDGASCHASTWASAKFTVLSWILHCFTWHPKLCMK